MTGVEVLGGVRWEKLRWGGVELAGVKIRECDGEVKGY